MDLGIVVHNPDFSVLLDHRIEAPNKEQAIIKLVNDPPEWIPEFMFFYPFSIITKNEIMKGYTDD